VLIWAALTIPPLIVGFIAVLLTGLTLGEIHHHAHHHVHTQRHPSETLNPKS
jgi:hypothetical protein